ncbi:SDR family oxidoreductase [Aphelenchoides besseyi]|nr:SDR family oxidoreductase [Aphelenchoides besseyi]KAI6208382.1 SDR family oxidoreductase [Aphelenchoides besseyi]
MFLVTTILGYQHLGTYSCYTCIHGFGQKSSRLIVSVSSICAKICLPTRKPYNVSKHAIAVYLDTIRVELAQ